MLYGLHLTVTAALNAWLWWLATHRLHHELAGAVFPVLVLLLGTIVASFASQYAQYFWLLAFGGLLVRRLDGPVHE